MSELLLGLLSNKYVRAVLAVVVVLLLLVGLYQGGKYAQRKITDAVNAAQDKLLSAMQKNIQDNFDAKFSTIQGSMDTQFAAINKSLEDNKNAIETDHSTLGSLNNVWMRVDGVQTTNPVSDSAGKAVGVATSAGGSDGTYYAKLPDASLQFLKGEAYRADQCAVRLNAAQQILVTRDGAFEAYQQAVQDALTAAKVK